MSFPYTTDEQMDAVQPHIDAWTARSVAVRPLVREVTQRTSAFFAGCMRW